MAFAEAAAGTLGLEQGLAQAAGPVRPVAGVGVLDRTLLLVGRHVPKPHGVGLLATVDGDAVQTYLAQAARCGLLLPEILELRHDITAAAGAAGDLAHRPAAPVRVRQQRPGGLLVILRGRPQRRAGVAR